MEKTIGVPGKKQKKKKEAKPFETPDA